MISHTMYWPTLEVHNERLQSVPKEFRARGDTGLAISRYWKLGFRPRKAISENLLQSRTLNTLKLRMDQA